MSFEIDQQAKVIELVGVAKRYPTRHNPMRSLWHALLNKPLPNDAQQFTSLHPCDFTVRRGEVVGVVGKNGAGKSTFLQLISGTLKPSEGLARITGQLSAILELGAGFNSEFSGRENVYLMMATSGLSKVQAQARIEHIIEFSGLGHFIDQPLKTYSSGMQVRLAFAIATCSEPDLLIIDEALSVGDGEFARKSFDRILKLKEQGTTILFCSHSLFHIEAICSRAIWIDAGKIVYDGHPQQVLPMYQDFLDGADKNLLLAKIEDSLRKPAPDSAKPTPDAELKPQKTVTSKLRKLSFAVIKPRADQQFFAVGDTAHLQSCEDTLKVRAWFDSDVNLPCPAFAATVHSMDGRIIASAGSWIDGTTLERNELGQGCVELSFESVALLKGTYSLSLFLFCERGLHIYSSADHVFHFVVHQDHLEQGFFRLPRTWSVRPGDSQV